MACNINFFCTLPKELLCLVKKQSRVSLWAGADDKKQQAKVKWSVVCSPK